MKRFKIVIVLIIFIFFSTFTSYAFDKSLTDEKVRQLIIQESISLYPGNCPCPYNVASNGSRCGGRSAWSRAGGYSPLCYSSDVTDKMVKEYRKRHGINKPKK